MLKKELTERVAITAGMSEYEAKKAVEAVFDAIRESLADGDDVVIRGFGKFTVKERAPRSVRNINTGEQYVIGSKKRVVFEPGKDLTVE